MEIEEKINLIEKQYNKVINERNGDDEYEKFFREMLKKYGVKEPDELNKKERKKFFQEIEKKWKEKR